MGATVCLVFDDGSFNEESTFLITDWFKHVPPSVLGKNFGVPAENFGHTPDPEQRYIFPLPVPGPLGSDRVTDVPDSFSFRLTVQTPLRTKSGTVRIADSNNFKAAKTIAAALVEIKPGGMRELHWHPNADEWQYYIAGQARMGVFGASEDARTFDFRAGDVGLRPVRQGALHRKYRESNVTIP
jgi:oxalate decarboxylase